MNITKLDIFNSALEKVGSRPLSSPDEKIKPAVLCNRFYPLALEELLRNYPFNCATKRIVLSPLAEKPVFEWEYQYILPTDYVASIKIYGNERFVIENGLLLSNQNPVQLKYTSLISTTADMDANFADCLVIFLTSKLAFPLTNDPQLAQSFLKELYQVTLPRAMSADGFEGHEEPKPESILDPYPPMLDPRYYYK